MKNADDGISRRRAIQLFAASAALSGAPAAAADAHLHRWSGVALGAGASLTLRHEDGREAGRLIALALKEIERLENIFSLYRPESALSGLNKNARLAYPPAELVELLSICAAVNRATGGAFDPAVQAVWAYHAETNSGAAEPDEARLRALVANSGWRHVSVASNEIRLSSPSAALTLNGVAQGYVTDRVTKLLRDNGLKDVLASVGEIAAFGTRGPYENWRVGLSGAGGESVAETIDLVDEAVATSAPLATTFDQAGRRGHILDPKTGRPAQSSWRQVSVVHRSAAIADGLSTGLTLIDPAAVERTISVFANTRVIAYDKAGRRRTFANR
ncbi:MAG: FAD:protein FMN transferase [Parvularculaceae bacterium]